MKYKDTVSQRLEYIRNQMSNLSRIVDGKKADDAYVVNTIDKLNEELSKVEDLVGREVQDFATANRGLDNEGRI